MSKKNSLVRGGLPAPTKEWYENRNQAGNPQPFATYKNSHIFLGFNITPNQFAAIEERIMGLLRVNELYKESFGSYSTTIKHWSILECLAAEFPFLFSEQVPGWWAYDALKGWIKKDATWMKTNQGATKADRRLKSHAGGPPQKKLKVAGMVLLKHCHFMVSVRGEAGSATIVPLVDLLLEGKRPDDGVADLQAWDLKSALLFSALAGDIEFEAHDMLVYTITGVAGEKIDVLITNDTHLRNAAMCLRTPGNTALFLEVIRSVNTEYDFEERSDRYQTPQPTIPSSPLTPAEDIAQRADSIPSQQSLLKEPTIKQESGVQEPLDQISVAESNRSSMANYSPDSVIMKSLYFDDETFVAESVDDEIAGLIGSDIKIPYSPISRRRKLR